MSCLARGLVEVAAQGWLHGYGTCIVTQDPMLGRGPFKIMLCYFLLDFFNNLSARVPIFIFLWALQTL